MPINCPINMVKYNACQGCTLRYGDECWCNSLAPQKLSGILTIDERVAIIEDRLSDPNITGNIKRNEARFIKSRDYQRLERMILLVEEKLNNHIDKTAKPKSNYS